MGYGIVVSDDKRHDKPTVGPAQKVWRMLPTPALLRPSAWLQRPSYVHSRHPDRSTRLRSTSCLGDRRRVSMSVPLLHRHRYPTQTGNGSYLTFYSSSRSVTRNEDSEDRPDKRTLEVTLESSGGASSLQYLTIPPTPGVKVPTALAFTHWRSALGGNRLVIRRRYRTVIAPLASSFSACPFVSP